jgi:hypothetical protein
LAHKSQIHQARQIVTTVTYAASHPLPLKQTATFTCTTALTNTYILIGAAVALGHNKKFNTFKDTQYKSA